MNPGRFSISQNAQLANQQMDQYAPFIEPAAQAQSGMGRGGVINAEPEEPQPDPEMASVERALRIARIAAALQQQGPESSYVQ